MVTVDEIVAAAGVSKRTFFRFFTSKEEVVVQFLADMGVDMGAELAARPRAERPAVALLRAVSSPLDACNRDSDRALPVAQLTLRTPALRARFLERQAQRRDDPSSRIAERLGLDPATDLYPQLAAGLALTAFDVLLQRWSDNDGAEEPAALTDCAFAVITPGLNRTG